MRDAKTPIMLCAPARLRAAVAGLDDAQLDTPYREAGWTVRQVVHHVVDSHVNAYVRFRWALTEDGPVIKPYEEKEWARLPDATTAPVAVSLDLLDALHTRWLILLRAMAPEQFERRWTGPDHGELASWQLASCLPSWSWLGPLALLVSSWLAYSLPLQYLRKVSL